MIAGRSLVVALVAALALLAGTASAGIIKVKSSSGPANERLQDGVNALLAGDAAGADKAFTAALDIDPKSAGAHLGLAQADSLRGKHDTATVHFQKARELAPNNADVEALWGAYLRSRNRLAEAETVLKKAATLDAKAADPHVFLGDLYLVNLKRPKDAVAEYRAATAAEPANAGAHYGLGLALQAAGDMAGAEREVSEATRLEPRNPIAFMALGKILGQAGRYPQAISAFDTAIQLHPTFAAAYIEKGRVQAATGNDAAAIETFQAALAKVPKLSEAQVEVGMVYQRQKRWPEAERAYKAAIEIDPKNAIAYNNAAWMWADQKTNRPMAVSWAQKAVSLSPNVPEFAVTLGWAYRADGNLPKALDQLRKAAAAKPRDAGIQYRTGIVLSEMGRKAEAADALKKALALDPKFPDADAARKMLGDLGAR
jgi:tetratricopeptide (TPR) repeat protein